MATITVPVVVSDAELKLLQTLVYQECGMHFDERRIHFLQDRLQRRLRACSLDSFYSYYRLLTSREGKMDLSYSALRTAQEASYSDLQMEPVDYGFRLRYFDKAGDRYTLKKGVKELVHFDFHNLKTEFLPQRNDVIFCRNVMIYFDEAEQKRLIEKFYRCLNPEGYLFIGHAESLFGLSDKFKMIHLNNGTAYQRIEVNS